MLSALAALLMMLGVAPSAFAASPAAAPVVTDHVITAEAAAGTDGSVDVFATSQSSALQIDGQGGKFATTGMSHDEGSTRFYARLPVVVGQSVTSITVRTVDDAQTTVTVDVRTILVTQSTFDGATLTVAATASGAATYPLTVEAGGAVGELPSAAPVAFALTAPPQTITVSSGGMRTTAPVIVTGGATSPTGTPPAGPTSPPACAPGPCGAGAVRTGGSPSAKVASTRLSAPRGLVTVIDGGGSTNATRFTTVIKSGPQGATLVDDTTSRPSIVLPTWAAPTDVLPRVAPALTPTVVAFTASNGTASSAVDVTVDPVGDAVAVITARSGADFQVGGTSTIPGAGPTSTPPTQVVVYARVDSVNDPTGLEQGWVKVGSAAVGPTGAFSVRSRPAADVNYVQYLVQTSRGTQVSGSLGR